MEESGSTPALVNVTLRLSREATETMRRLSRQEGVPMTVLLQGALECVTLFLLPGRARVELFPDADSPLWDRAIAQAWDHARQLSLYLAEGRQEPGRDKIVVRYDRVHHAMIRERGLPARGYPSLTAAVSTVFERGWGDPDVQELKREIWTWLLRRARDRQFDRLRGGPGLPLGSGLRIDSFEENNGTPTRTGVR